MEPKNTSTPSKLVATGEEGTEAIFVRRVLIAAGISIVLVVTVLIAYATVWVLFLFFAAILIAVVLRGMTNLVTRYTRLSDRLALSLVVFLIVALTVVAIWALIPRIAIQIDQLSVQLPRALNDAIARMNQTLTGKWILKQMPSGEDFKKNVGGMLQGATTFLSGATDIIVGFIVVVFGSLYLAYDPEMYSQGLIRLVPIPRRQRFKYVLDNVGYMLFWWMIGRFIDMLLIGVLTGIGLWLLNIPLVLTLSILAGLLTFIPNFGPIISAIPALLLAIPAGLEKFLYVILLYVIIHAIEGYIISPIVQEKTALVPAVLTLVVQIGFGILFGFLGLAMATPIAAAALVFIKALYIEDVLGDRINLIEIEADGPPPAGL
jgi:predicted PurR-regulated permease PerM